MLLRTVRERSLAQASLLAIGLALAFGGCGSGGEASSQPPAGSTSPATGQTGESSLGTGQGEANPGSGKASGGEGSGGSAGGEKSIETFGSEASGGERAALVGAFEGYLNAVAGEDPAAACAHLSATVQRSLERFASKSLKRKGCAAILPRLLAPAAAEVSREQANGEITRVRLDGDRGFVIFDAPGAKLYEMPMAREDGEWKVGLVAAAVLVPQR